MKEEITDPVIATDEQLEAIIADEGVKEEITEEETIVEEATEEPEVEEVETEEASFGDEVKTEDKTEVKSSGTVSSTPGAAGQYYNGPCTACDIRICMGKVENGKVRCLNCSAENTV